jgi:hypothetical protein
MKKIHKDHAARQEAYRERQKEKQETAAEAAVEREKAARLDLRFFGESGFERSAESSHEEINIHRQFLRALGQPDVQNGETVRDLARRTWNALLNAEQIGVYQTGHDVWIPMFSTRLQQFDSWHGYSISGALRPGYFEEHWQLPKDSSGIGAISLEDLPSLPPIKRGQNRNVDL